MDYRCGKCRRNVEFDTNNIGMRCPYCGSKVFYKERPTGAKKVFSR